MNSTEQSSSSKKNIKLKYPENLTYYKNETMVEFYVKYIDYYRTIKTQ